MKVLVMALTSVVPVLEGFQAPQNQSEKALELLEMFC